MTLRFRYCLVLLLCMVSAACAPDARMKLIPTQLVLPTPLPTLTPSATVATSTPIIPTATPTSSETPTFTATATASATITETLTPSDTPTPENTSTPVATNTPDTGARVNNTEGVNLRTGPSVYFEPPMQLLDKGTFLDLLAISDNGEWYKVHTPTGATGWVYGRMINVTGDTAGLPVEIVPLPTLPPPPPPSLVNGPLVLNPPTTAGTTNQGGIISIPAGGTVPLSGPIIGGVSSRVMQIYQAGQALGNNPRMFAKVGDSITSNQPFMIGFGTGEYNLGAYGSFQDTINYFNPSGAFTRTSIAASAGFTAVSLNDPLFSPQGTCLPNETPLMCEYRVSKPAIAIIMLGSADIQFFDIDTYRNNMTQIINQSASMGVIPVLTTFSNGADYFPQQAEAFNNLLRSLASQEQIPLIDFRPGCLALPGRGVLRDQFHLTTNGGNFINFNGDQNQYGITLRNLMTMQTLDSLRRSLNMN